MLKFDGVTIYEMSTVQLERALKQNSHRLSPQDVKQIEDLIQTKGVIAVRDAKSKRQIDPDFAKNNF